MPKEYVEGKTFEQKVYSNDSLNIGEYENCRFQQCDFSNADLSEIKFIESEFIECNLSNSTISKTALQNVYFEGCKILGVLFEDCNKFGFNIRFKNCQLNHSSFYQMNLQKIEFIDSQLHEVDFTEAILIRSKIDSCDLSNAVFEFTNLEYSDFRNSINYSIDPEKNKLKGAKFSIPEVLRLLDKYQLIIEQ